MVIILVALIAGAIGGIFGAATTIAAVLEMQDWKHKQLQAARERRAQIRVVSAKVKSQRLLKDAVSEERKRKRKERERKRQEREAAQRAKQEAERAAAERKRVEVEQAAAEAARAKIEARAKAEQALATWKDARLAKKPSPKHLAAVFEENSRQQYRCGKYVHVFVLIADAGAVVEWRVQADTLAVPHVLGICDNQDMFKEWKFLGRHTVSLPPGRHVLAFDVTWGTKWDGEPDVSFEIFIPQGKRRGDNHFQRAVDARAKEFVHRTSAVTRAKRKVSETLAAAGNDPDESIVEMARFEAEIKDLEQGE